jgi:uncharacterized protein YjbJ (UPF0337 family)
VKGSRNRAQGRLHQVRGKFTEAAGKSRNRDLETRGKREEMAGDIQIKLSRAEKMLRQ